MKNLSKIIVLFILIVVSILAFTKETKSDVPERIQNIHTADEEYAIAIAKTIALIETGNTLDCSRIGKNGEQSCYQFLQSTWSAYSVDVLGYIAPQTPENTKKVVEGKVAAWKKQGLTDRQIFLIWNQGHSGKCSKGINKKGVPYDSCTYAENAVATLNKVIHIN